MSNNSRLLDADALYNHVASGLTLVSGSDLKFMDEQIAGLCLKLNSEDELILKANWKLVRARLESEGYV